VLTGVPLDHLTAPVLLGVVVLLILLGWLVPRKQLMEKTKEADRWYDAYEKEREARVRSDEQTSELLEVSKTSNAILTAMFGREGVIRKSGGPNAVSKKD
jgi:hypothetical protein